jgi:acetyl esterase/lipase
MIRILLACALLGAPQGSEPLVVDLWPGKAPNEAGEIGPEQFVESKPGELQIQRLTNVSKPTIAVYRPAKERDTGTAVVVCPGGGYRILAMEHEGTQVATWLASIGVTAVLLKYRVPRRPGDDDNRLPLQDAQRALSLVRTRAAEWGVDPARIGILGFSAGGHLAANASTNPDRRAYDAVDDADRAGCRPDFAVLVYPGGVLDRQDPAKLSAQIRITKDTPPSFLVVSTDDKGSAPGTLRLYLALREAGVPTELHVYATGGHGYGMKRSDQPFASWPRRCEDWMRSRGLLKPAAR